MRCGIVKIQYLGKKMPLFDQMQLCQESAMKVLVVLEPQGVNHQQEFGEELFQEIRGLMVLTGFLGKA